MKDLRVKLTLLQENQNNFNKLVSEKEQGHVQKTLPGGLNDNMCDANTAVFDETLIYEEV